VRLVDDVAVLQFSEVCEEGGEFFLSNLLIDVADVQAGA
jgi:hypothetical protein